MKDMRNSVWVVSVAALLLISAIWFGQKSPQVEGEIVIGAPLILSGDFTAYGERVRNGILMAVEDFRKEHPEAQIRIVFEDTQGEVKQVVSAYQKLTQVDQVDLIIGPMLQVEMAALMPLVLKDNVPMISLAPIPLKDRGTYTNPIVVWPDPTREAEQMAEYIYGKGVTQVGVLGTQDSWENEVTEAFALRFSALGGSVISKEITLPDSQDSRLPVTKVLATKPEALFFGTYYKFLDFVKIARELGYEGPLYSIEIDSYLAEQTAGYSDGLQFISPNFYTEEFVSRYEEMHGEKPTLPAGQAYDAAILALDLLFENGNLRPRILRAMGDVKAHEGVSGLIIFDETHRAVFPLNIFEIRGGSIVKIN